MLKLLDSFKPDSFSFSSVPSLQFSFFSITLMFFLKIILLVPWKFFITYFGYNHSPPTLSTSTPPLFFLQPKLVTVPHQGQFVLPKFFWVCGLQMDCDQLIGGLAIIEKRPFLSPQLRTDSNSSVRGGTLCSTSLFMLTWSDLGFQVLWMLVWLLEFICAALCCFQKTQ